MKTRSGRLVRFLRGVFYAVVVLAVIHAGVTLWAGRKIEARLDELSEAGEPVAMADLAGPDIPAEENGATYLKQAAELMGKIPGNEEKKKAYQASISRDTKEHAGTDWARLESVLSAYDEVVQLIEKAMDCKQCRLPVDWKSNDIGAASAEMLPSFADLREFARLLSARSALAAHNGRTTEAVRGAMDVIRLSDCLKDEPTLIAQLVRYAIVSIGTRQLETAAASGALEVAEARAAWDTANGIDLSGSITTALKGERTFMFSAYPLLRREPRAVMQQTTGPMGQGARGPLSKGMDRVFGYLISPLVYLDQNVYMTFAESQIRATQGSLRERMRWTREADKRLQETPRYAIFTRMLAPVFGRAIAAQGTAEANVEGCKGLLAVQAYRAARGTYPQTLQEACSMLQRPIPADPFTGKALIYRRTATGFKLYSVGEDLRDDGGVTQKRNSAGRGRGDIVWSSESSPTD